MAIKAGISFAEFWEMTYREIKSVVEFYRSDAEEQEKNSIKRAAFTAYHTACLVRTKSIPSSIESAFPKLFGRTAEGGVFTSDWRESKRTMARFAEQHNAVMRSRKAGATT